jgi:O-antigen ligase
MRLASLSRMAYGVLFFMLARYGLKGVLSFTHFHRSLLFALMFVLSMTGGFRSALFTNVVVLALVFFLEGLHRTRWMVVALVAGLLSAAIVIPFARQLPDNIQRSLSFLPLNIDPMVKADADGSTEWRLAIWDAILPKVPEYLLLGKGYSLTMMDYESLGPDSPFRASAQANASLESLAISNDFHSGPLSTVVCFGIWGCISILAIMFAALYIVYHNFRYGDPGLRTINTLFLAMVIERIVYFFFIFGAYDNDVGWFAQFAGLSVAFNWGVCQAKAKTAPAPLANPKVSPKPASAPQPA